MSQQPNYFRLGIFILAAVAIFLVIVVALTAGQLFKRTVTMETYFDESVQGLDIGSAVKFRGVQLGRVTNIGFTSTVYEQDRPPAERKQYVLVESEVLPELVGGVIGEPGMERLREMILAGLRARLAPVGITGTAYLEIDYVDPRTNPLLEIAWAPEHFYIPSTTSTYNRIIAGAQNFLAKLADTDIDGVFTSIQVLVRTANDKLGELPVSALAHDASSTLKEFRQLAAQANRLVSAPELGQAVRDLAAAGARAREVLANPAWDTAPSEARQAFASVRAVAESRNLQDSLERLDRILVRLDALTAGSDADVAAALYNLRRITENLRDLTETTKRYPASVFSEPPRPVTLPSR
jgi:ABC-type transporter Mla subunit MlaD